MRGFLPTRALVCALLLPSASFGASYYLVTTGHAAADTELDVSHARTWSFTPAWNWDLGGGTLTIKRNNVTTADAVLTLYTGDASLTKVTDVRVSPLAVSTTYAPVNFTFELPVALTAGNDYRLVLASDAGDNSSEQYYIQGKDNDFTDFMFQTGTGGSLPAADPLLGETDSPEPGTWSMIGTAAFLAFWRRRRRKLEARNVTSRNAEVRDPNFDSDAPRQYDMPLQSY